MIAQTDPERSRDFICPCGKDYFSYAALFTHIKQKHNGKPPGQIIKPKPQHKRGRPRKLPPNSQPPSGLQKNSQAHSESALSCLAPPNLNQKGNNIKFITTSPPFKISSSSQFKTYRAETTPEPTLHLLPADNIENAPERSLLEDLTSNLVRLAPAKTQGVNLKETEAGKLLSEGTAGELVECLSGFITFCREGLGVDIANQIQMLVIVLLQHVYEKGKQQQQIKLLKYIHLNDHIQSFFGKIHGYVKQWELEEEPIFQGINPMKILVVLYNWINSVYAPHSEDKSVHPQSSNPSMSSQSPSIQMSDSSLSSQEREEEQSC